MTPEQMLNQATIGREVPDVKVAQALHALIAQCGYEDNPAVLADAAVAAGLGATYVFHFIFSELAEVGLILPSAIENTLKEVVTDAAAIFRDVAIIQGSRLS